MPQLTTEQYNQRTADSTPITITLPTNVATHLLLLCEVSCDTHVALAGTWISVDTTQALRSALNLPTA